MNLGQRLTDDSGVMLGEPVLEQSIRNPDRNGRTALGQKARRREPGVETGPIYLRFNPGENLLPEVHRLRTFSQQRYSLYFQELYVATSGNAMATSVCVRRTPTTSGFPQFFPQLWKSLVRDQTHLMIGC